MIKIRQLNISDIFKFVPLYQIIFPEKNITEEKISAIFKKEPATIYLAQVSSQFVGFIYFLTVVDEVEIIDIGVHPDFRKKGIGRKLLKHGIDHAQKKNSKRILLEVHADNKIAISLYEKLGFVFVRSRQGYYSDGADAWVYERV